MRYGFYQSSLSLLLASGTLSGGHQGCRGCNDTTVDSEETGDTPVIIDSEETDDVDTAETASPDDTTETASPDDTTETASPDDTTETASPDDTTETASPDDTAETDEASVEVTSFDISNNICTYTSRILSDGTLVCSSADGNVWYYDNDGDSSTQMSGDLDLDGTPDAIYNGGVTWIQFGTGLGTNVSSFAEDPVSGDIYYTALDGLTFDSNIRKRAGGVNGIETVVSSTSDYFLTTNSITSDDAYVYGRVNATTVRRISLATGIEDTDLTISGVPTGNGSAVDDTYLYFSNDLQVWRVDKAAGGAGELIIGSGLGGSVPAVDGTIALGTDIRISGYSAASVSDGYLYFVDITGYSQAWIRYVDENGALQTVDGIESGVNQGVYVRGNVLFSRTDYLFLLE